MRGFMQSSDELFCCNNISRLVKKNIYIKLSLEQSNFLLLLFYVQQPLDSIHLFFLI